MKEIPEKHPEYDPETYTNPILEECYRIKAEISAQFKTPAEFSAYLKALEEENKRYYHSYAFLSIFAISQRITVPSLPVEIKVAPS